MRSPRIQEWVVYPFSRGSFQPKNQTGFSCIAGGFFTNWAIREAPKLMKLDLIHDPIVSISPRNVILINMSGITNKVICLINPLYPPEEEKAICMGKKKKKTLPFPCSPNHPISYILKRTNSKPPPFSLGWQLKCSPGLALRGGLSVPYFTRKADTNATDPVKGLVKQTSGIS